MTSEGASRTAKPMSPQKFVANTALGVSAGAATGATIGTIVAPGAGSVIGAIVGGLAGFAAERFVDVQQPRRDTRNSR